MFGIGMPEMILILAVALIVIGPKKLPDLAKSLGRAMGEFKKATSDFKETMAIDSEIKEVKEAIDDIGDDLKDSMTFEADLPVETKTDLPSEPLESDDPTPETDLENAEGSKPDA